MTTQMFVNLPVKNLKQSIEFFTQLGFQFNPQFTDETTTCMIVGEESFVMLVTEDKFKQFTPKAICDATKSTEVLMGLSCASVRDKKLEKMSRIGFHQNYHNPQKPYEPL
jgi:predicted lactoylglutathione lyase